MLWTPLTGAVDVNMALEGPELTTGTVVSLSVMSAREIRMAAASAPATFWHGALAPGTQDTKTSRRLTSARAERQAKEARAISSLQSAGPAHASNFCVLAAAGVIARAVYV
jgi:hypothetical protein